MWNANEVSSHHTSFGRTSGITNIRMPPLQICGHCRARPKSNAVLVPVRRALKIILQQNKPLGHASPINVCFLHKSRHPRRNYLFSTTMGARPVSGFSKTKQRLDKEMLTELGNLEPWVIHDIRRTMRTGLSALPVPDLVRELVIGHTKPGLHKVYDQHAYIDEKRHALELWAARLHDIVQPAPANVVKLARKR